MSEEKPLIEFLPAVVVESKSIGFYVEYYIVNPMTGLRERKRVRLQRLVKKYGTKAQKRMAAQKVANEINRRVAGGWSPFFEQEDSRLYTPLDELRRIFLTAKENEGVRPATLRSYTSQTNIFLKWCRTVGIDKKFSGCFQRIDAVKFTDYMISRRNAHRTYNNCVKTLRVFFGWAVEHCYCDYNHFANIKMLSKEQKRRTLIDHESRQRIAMYFRQTRPQMEIVCKLVYYSAMRPAEIAKIKVGNVSLKDRYIYIPADVAKNGRARYATLSRDLISLLVPVLKKADKELYLFGQGKDMAPGRKMIQKTYFSKVWMQMRRDLALPETMQLYSLRDSGLSDMLHAGIDPLTVRQHADHSSAAMQDIYTNHHNPALNDIIYNNAPEF